MEVLDLTKSPPASPVRLLLLVDGDLKEDQLGAEDGELVVEADPVVADLVLPPRKGVSPCLSPVLNHNGLSAGQTQVEVNVEAGDLSGGVEDLVVQGEALPQVQELVVA